MSPPRSFFAGAIHCVTLFHYLASELPERLGKLQTNRRETLHLSDSIVVNRTTYHILVAWREGKGNVSSEEPERFAAARQFFIDQGFMNLQAEWYASGAAKLPDLIRLFVYWEDPDTSPSYEQLRTWGNEAAGKSD